MEVKSQRDRSQCSFMESQSTEIRSIHLRKRKNSFKSLSSSCDRLSTYEHSSLLSSISRKLQPSNIQVLSKLTSSVIQDVRNDKYGLRVSCFPMMETSQPEKQVPLEYQKLRNWPSRQQQVVANVHKLIGDKKGCLEPCPIKRKWIKKVDFYSRQLKNVWLFREKAITCPEELETQIEKDVIRTFPANVITRKRINVLQQNIHNDKFDLLECVRHVLKLYASYDQQIGYVQGMNLVCGAVALHTKDVDSCFVIFKEIMYYGKLRQCYLDSFELLNSELKDLYHKQLRQLNQPLYDFLIESGVDQLMFMQYYITMFASIVDIEYMHIVIDLFMRDGIAFLHKMLLALLLWLKNSLMTPGDQDSVIPKLGANYLRELGIDWEDLLVNCLKIDLF